LAPGEFLHLIKDSELEIALGEWVMQSALQQVAQWNAAGLRLTVSVNISALHLQQVDFAARLATLLAGHAPVDSSQLELEILESSAFEDIEHVSRTLKECLALGVRFALDDFGTGYSSLAYFRRLPVETLKIDQAFVRDMLDDPEDLGIVESVIRLAQAFNRPVIAEGVESIEHGALLVQMGCHFAQGYGIARPMPAEQMLDWVRRWHGESAWRGLDDGRLANRDVVLMVAQSSLRKWVDEVAASLRTAPAEILPDNNSHQCRFGRWYHGSGASQYGHLPEFATLNEPHERIHVLASELLALADSNQRPQAVARLPELYAVRDAVCLGLERLVARVRD
jgi:EAL domain-containing protein (putative c-di-GMP-specific phosphodiesterase class I)